MGDASDSSDFSDSKSKKAPATPPKASFKAVRSALVLVQSGQMSGSGFIVTIDGKLYVLTNAHVLDNVQSVSLRNLTGDKLKYTKIEFANNQDLVRIHLSPSEVKVQPLTFADDTPTVGETVVVHGNSQGSDVITELTGRVLGVGPSKIEVDAEFVQGNSGSPILNADGKVLAVATYVTQTSKDLDWVANNTRFAEPRRFGIIPQDVKWVSIDGRKLRPQLTLLSDVEALVTDLALLLENWRPHSEQRQEAMDMLSNYSAESMQGSYTNTGWPQSIEKFCKAYTELASNDERKSGNGKRTAKVSKTSFQYGRLGADRDKTLQSLCKQAESKLSQAKWSTDFFKAQSDQYVEWLDQLATSFDQAMKTPGWGHLIYPNAVPREWSGRPGLQQQ